MGWFWLALVSILSLQHCQLCSRRHCVTTNEPTATHLLVLPVNYRSTNTKASQCQNLVELTPKNKWILKSNADWIISHFSAMYSYLHLDLQTLSFFFFFPACTRNEVWTGFETGVRNEYIYETCDINARYQLVETTKSNEEMCRQSMVIITARKGDRLWEN